MMENNPNVPAPAPLHAGPVADQAVVEAYSRLEAAKKDPMATNFDRIAASTLLLPLNLYAAFRGCAITRGTC